MVGHGVDCAAVSVRPASYGAPMSSRTRSDFGTLGDRVASTTLRGQLSGSEGGNPTPAPSSASGPVEPYSVEARHVWLDGQHAGLLVGWQRPGSEWLGQVVWAPAEHPHHVVVDWIASSRLRQAR